ncbi:DUF4232 domain-containing protein [Nocardia sp. 004]|uniref:DUF4232 domain-containing protein n=1 Tax=Nocardia sp. 004 TaxID=3385978 RepID=UPI0039A07417
MTTRATGTVLLSGCAVLVLLSGCAASDSPGTAPVTGLSVVATAPTGSGPAVTTTAPVSQSVVATTAATPVACGSGQVDVAVGGSEAAMGHRGVQLSFSLAAGAPPCTVTGYPGVDAVGGGPVVSADRTPNGYLGGLPIGQDTAPTVLLEPGRTAHALLEAVAYDSSGRTCAESSSILVTPPDSTDTRSLPVTIATCRLQVHPVTG